MLFQPVDPFPDPTHAGQEIENVGLMFAIIVFMFFFVLLMLYFYSAGGVSKSPERFVPVIMIWLSSITLGMSGMSSPFFPFSPSFEIFFILFQTILFILIALETYQEKNGNPKRR